MTEIRLFALALAGLLALPTVARPQSLGLWTSSAELATIPKSGDAWTAVLAGADRTQNAPDLGNQDDDTNCYVLASAIVWARTGDERYRNQVITALELIVAQGHPGGQTLAWAREGGAYALAADTVGYRTVEFEGFLRNLAEVWLGTDGRTLLGMFKKRPNNWGTHAFGTLVSIYGYLKDGARLKEVRDYWVAGVEGTQPGWVFGDDLSWQADPTRPRQINARGASRDGVDLDGVLPEELRRGGPFQEPPLYTGYCWEALQGLVLAARVLDRLGQPIWASGDRAVFRAADCLQVRYAARYGSQWQASGDDAWMLPFLDRAYGTRWSGSQSRLWEHGKNAGWGYVTLAGTATSEGSGTTTTKTSRRGKK